MTPEDQPEVDAAWREEIGGRVDDVLDGRVELVDADEHYAQLRGGLESRHEGRTWPPEFFGSIESTNNGRTDNSRRVDELLAEGFGRDA